MHTTITSNSTTTSMSTSTTTTHLPRNYAFTHLPRSSFNIATSCFDFSDLMSFATASPIDDAFNLEPEVEVEECPSSTPYSELDDEENDSDTPLELTYSGRSTATGGSGRSTSSSTCCTESLLSGTASRMASPGRLGLGLGEGVRVVQDDVIEGVIRKLEGYALGLGGGDGMELADVKGGAKGMGSEGDGQIRISRSGLMGVRPKVVSDADCMLWTRVWGSATAVRNARERRGRRMERKARRDGSMG